LASVVGKVKPVTNTQNPSPIIAMNLIASLPFQAHLHHWAINADYSGALTGG
jgi:hypothetical protein